MAGRKQITFSEYLDGEQHKRVIRNFKLARLKEKLGSSGTFSINPDSSDSSDSITNTHYTRSSKHGSEVVSSSHNVKNIFLGNQNIEDDINSIVTPTVTNLNNKIDSPKEYSLMLPPKCNSVRVSKKLTGAAVRNNMDNTSVLQNERVSLDMEKDSLKKTSTNFLRFSADMVRNKKPRTFTRWKVMLNEQGRLTIKGTIETGEVARSKPILRKLTTRIVYSLSNHLYSLHGNLCDDEHELPDYVKNKFYSGFPDDWENVFQIWRAFVQQGSKLTFRWPTTITDSDDDLKSEVTDVTYALSDSLEDTTVNCSSFKETHTPPKSFRSESTFNVLQSEQDRQSYTPQSRRKNDSFTQTHVPYTKRNSFRNVAVQTPISHNSHNKENYEQQESISSDCSDEKKKNKLRNELNDMIHKFTAKNCSQECMKKLINIVACISDVMQHVHAKDGESCMKDSQSNQSQCTVQEGNNKTRCSSREYCPSASISLLNTTEYDGNRYENTQVHCKDSNSVETQDMLGHRITDCNNSLQKKNNFTEMNKEANNDNPDSDNEIYAGVPKIPVDRLLGQRKTLMKPGKRNQVHQDYNTKEEKCSSEILARKNYTETLRSKTVNSLGCNDSSISIIENETEGSQVKRSNTSVKRNLFKYRSLDTTEKEQTETEDTFTRDENEYEMQEHFVKKNFKTPQKSIKDTNDSSGIIEDNESAMVHLYRVKRKNEMTETNSRMETSNRKAVNVNSQRQNGASQEEFIKPLCQSDNIFNKTPKPCIISSVPVNMDVTMIQEPKMRVIKNNNEGTKNGETRSLKEQELPLRKSDATKNINSILSFHCNEDVNPLTPCKADSTTSKKLVEDKSVTYRGSKNKDICKPKQLFDWIPRVVHKPKLGLTFEGTLLVEADHGVRKKFRTQIVRRRISQRLIETVNREFYELIGDLNDIKQVVPKKLVNLCRYGCPSKIEQFCKIWLTYDNDSGNSTSAAEGVNDSMDTINIGVSSKGRRIVPPLDYWYGERIALRNNNPVYCRGIFQPSRAAHLCESPGKSKDLNKTKKQETEKNKQNSWNESQNVNADLSGKLANIKSTHDSNEFKSIRKPVTKNKRRIVEQAQSSDSDDDRNVPVIKKQRVRESQQESLNSVEVMNKRGDGGTKMTTRTTRSKIRANTDVIVSRADTSTKQM